MTSQRPFNEERPSGTVKILSQIDFAVLFWPYAFPFNSSISSSLDMSGYLLLLHYVPRPRRHQHEGRFAVREGPDDPHPPPDLAVDALDPVVRPDPVPVLGREFRVGQRFGVLFARRPLVAFGPDRLGRLLFEQRVERPIVYRCDVRRRGSCPFVDDLLLGRLKLYDDAWTVFLYVFVNL